MKLTWRDVDRFSERVYDFIANTEHGQKIVDGALGMGAGDETVIVLTPHELEGNGTACGCVNNTCFEPEITQFLDSQGVKQLVVGILPEEGTEEGPLVVCGAVPIPYEGVVVKNWRDWFPVGSERFAEMEEYGELPTPAQVLSELVGEKGGSWRDDCCVPGWSTYESE